MICNILCQPGTVFLDSKTIKYSYQLTTFLSCSLAYMLHHYFFYATLLTVQMYEARNGMPCIKCSVLTLWLGILLTRFQCNNRNSTMCNVHIKKTNRFFMQTSCIVVGVSPRSKPENSVGWYVKSLITIIKSVHISMHDSQLHTVLTQCVYRERSVLFIRKLNFFAFLFPLEPHRKIDEDCSLLGRIISDFWQLKWMNRSFSVHS